MRAILNLLNSFSKVAGMLIFTLLMLSFSSSSFSAAKTSDKGDDDNLTQAFAQKRKAQIKKVSYDIFYKFEKNSKSYIGKIIAKIELSNTKTPLTFDFSGSKLSEVKVNSVAIPKPGIKNGQFQIASKYLKVANEFEISFENEFNESGFGLQRFEDPADKEVYIYSDSEPYFAHTFFPCLDQPDIKATVNLKMNLPKEWTALGNELIVQTTLEGERKTVQFKMTPPISTYLVFVGAGPFVEWKDDYEKLPLFIHARKSLAKYVDYKRLFTSTKKGLKFFNEYFAYKYPFSKYGHVFVPEFNWSGMENPGAVTLNERNIFRGKVTESDYQDRDSLILHEMAHMWFGDLVTMKWWDDLWLNESFASYLASIALEREMKSDLGKLGAISSNSWAFWQDQLVTTHPIETKVPDTRTARGNFDGITYAKGQAALKQLHFYVGEENFKKGLQAYFKDHAFSNTLRADFIGAIAKASNVNLDRWTHAWLQTSGPNRVEAKWTCEEGKISQFSIEQEPSSSGTLSPHKTRVATFRSKGERLQKMDVVEVVYSERSNQVPELIGKKCPQFVFPNLDGMDYALFSFDPQSKLFVKNLLEGGSEDPAIRLQTWQMIAQMVRDLKLTPQEYFDFATTGLSSEKNETILSILSGRHSPVRQYFFDYLNSEERVQIGQKFEVIFRNRFNQASAGSNIQMMFFDIYTAMATSKESQLAMREMLDGKGIPKGLDLSQERRWNIIRQLAFLGYPNVEAMVHAEELRDPSQIGKRNAFAARNSVPSVEVKNRFWKTMEKPQEVSFSTLKFAARGFHSPLAIDLSEQFVKPFFQRVSNMDWKKNDNLVEVYFEDLFPFAICNKALLSESEKRFKAAKNLTLLANRAWREANDELSKCVAIRR